MTLKYGSGYEPDPLFFEEYFWTSSVLEAAASNYPAGPDEVGPRSVTEVGPSKVKEGTVLVGPKEVDRAAALSKGEPQ